VATYQQTFEPYEPTGRDRIPEDTLAYFRTRNQLRLFTMLQVEFDRSGLTQADLAARLGKGTDRICRLMSEPGNLTANTISDLLFAIGGLEETHVVTDLFPAVSISEPTFEMQYSINLPTINIIGSYTAIPDVYSTAGASAYAGTIPNVSQYPTGATTLVAGGLWLSSPVPVVYSPVRPGPTSSGLDMPVGTSSLAQDDFGVGGHNQPQGIILAQVYRGDSYYQGPAVP
jgi:hypothetical protein